MSSAPSTPAPASPSSFGFNGASTSKQGLDRDPKTIALVQSLTPGRVFEDLLILGSATNQGYGSAPGDIRAFDVRTGKLVWTFHTVPRPGEFGYDTWPKDAWKTVGGANVWSEFSVDDKRGILYAPDRQREVQLLRRRPQRRKPLQRLPARARRPHRQAALALPDGPSRHLGLRRRHRAQAPHRHATNGKKSTSSRKSQQAGLRLGLRPRHRQAHLAHRGATRPASPTCRAKRPGRPSPSPPSRRRSRARRSPSTISARILTPEDRAKFRDEILSARNEGLFTPPATRNTIQMPGNNGGANWGGAAVDPTTGRLYVVSKDLPAMLKLETEAEQKKNAKDTPEQHGLAVYTTKCGACHGLDRLGKPPAIPGVADVAIKSTRDELVQVVEQGKGPMPGTKITKEELTSLVAYLYNPTRATANVPTAPPAPGEDKYFSGFGFMIASNGLSPIKPPWSSLTAYDLNLGTILWKIPLGDVPELAAKGIKGTGSHYPKVGPVVTAGGLIFTGTETRRSAP